MCNVQCKKCNSWHRPEVECPACKSIHDYYTCLQTEIDLVLKFARSMTEKNATDNPHSTVEYGKLRLVSSNGVLK